MANPVPEKNKLPHVFLGQCGIKVSNLCLGAMTFGDSGFGTPGQADEHLSHQIMNRFSDWGGNFIDTADIYGYGISETIVGKWFESKKWVIAILPLIKKKALDNKFAHIFDDGTPLEETFRTFDDLVRCGKVRYVGVSNFTGWQLQKLVDVSEKLGLNPIVSLQQQYNLVNRESEWEPFQVCKKAGIGVLPWSPLKCGLLTGKVKRGQKPTEGRMAWVANDETKESPVAPLWTKFDAKTFNLIDAVKAIAKNHKRSPAQVAIRWLLQKDVVSSVIIGARNLAQLEDNLGAGNGWSLSKEEMQQLDELSLPGLPYPYEMVFKLNSDRQNRQAINPYVQSLYN